MASAMEYNYLGRTGVRVSSICLGTMTFGGDADSRGCDEKTAHEMLDKFVELGGNFVDTADVCRSPSLL